MINEPRPHLIDDSTLRYAMLAHIVPPDTYNYEHFQTKHLLEDARRTLSRYGIQPGQLAPDFTLPKVGGGLLRLSELRDKPVLLHFTSYSCPFSISSVEPLKKLYVKWSNHVHFVDVFIRQAHPGTNLPPYRMFADKMDDAERYQAGESIPWPVVVDDLAGTVHQVYGGLSNPAYLIDLDGNVSFYNIWTYAPHLYKAILALLNRDGRGVIYGGRELRPHMMPVITDGWRGLERGMPQSVEDMQKAVPGMASLLWAGCQLKPMLAPMTLRATPAPNAASALPYGIFAALVMYLIARKK